MQRYYHHAGNISHCSKLVLSRFLHRNRAHPSAIPGGADLSDDDFTVEAGRLSLKSPTLLGDRPEAAMKAFEFMHKDGIEMGQELKDSILAVSESATSQLRCSKEAANSFIEILKSREPYRVLSEMHSLRFLGAYIPEFR